MLITIPHSGESIPPEAFWLQGLPEELLMYDVDRFIDQLYEPSIRALGLSMVKTHWHRYAVDLNRIPEDIDPNSVKGAPGTPGIHSRGFHWTVTTGAHVLMPEPMDFKLHTKLQKLIYDPFHQEIREAVNALRGRGNQKIFHLDLHSMPSEGTFMHRDPGEVRADIVISDCSGQSASKDFRDAVISAYCVAGFKVAYNWPYLGGRLTEQYGAPQKGHETLQVELKRGLYMNEVTKKLNEESLFTIQKKLQRALERIANWTEIPVNANKGSF